VEGGNVNKIYAKINNVSNKTASIELLDILKKGLLGIESKGTSIKYIPTT